MHRWHPLENLRTDRLDRKPVDRELVGGLRAWLEDAAYEALEIGGRATEGEHVLGRRALCDPSAGRIDDETVARRTLETALIRLTLRNPATESRGEHASRLLREALDLCAVEGGRGFAALRALDLEARRRLLGEVRSSMGTLEEHFGGIPAAWLPRVADRLAVPLAGGRIVLVGVTDLLLGAAPTQTPSRSFVDVRPARETTGHHALLETLRSGAPPLRAGALSLGATGTLSVVEPSEELLVEATARTAEALVTWARTVADEEKKYEGMRMTMEDVAA